MAASQDRRLAAVLAALALAGACRSPTAPLYEGACSLGWPRAAAIVTLCYTICPKHAAQFAAEGDAQYTALATCAVTTP